MHQEIILAGFGGQGILFAGKLLAYAAMKEGKQVSWLPSYGPEMRGGTANCHVIISDEPISSPIIINPTVLIAMNKPSLEKFENNILEGGSAVIDSSLVDREALSLGKSIMVAATQMAHDIDAVKLANIIMVGKCIKELEILPLDVMLDSLKAIVPPSKPQLAELNQKAFMLGYNS